MRIKLTFDFSERLNLPYSYFEDLQHLIYRLLAEYPDVDWLHNEGIEYQKRKIKPLVYSHLIGKREALKRNWRYYAPISLYISSPLPALIKAIETNIKKLAYYRFGGKTLVVTGYEIEETEKILNREIKTLSPIVVSTPILLPTGKIYQKYVDAFDPDFSRILQENLQRKAKVFYNLNLNSNFQIKPIFDFNNKKNYNHLFYYKNTVIKGWSGKFVIHGDLNYIYTANNCGLGSKNAQGFGLIEII